jgi:hypothetical protein
MPPQRGTRRVDGRIISIAAGHDGTDIMLDNDPAVGPLNNVLGLRSDHDNYNAIYSLALAAAANRWVVRIGIEGAESVDPQRAAVVKLIRVTWP